MTSSVLKVLFCGCWSLFVLILEKEIPLEKRMILFDHLYDATQAAFLIFNMEAE